MANSSVHVEWPQLAVCMLVLIVAQVFLTGGLVYWHAQEPHPGSVTVAEWRVISARMDKLGKTAENLIDQMAKSREAIQIASQQSEEWRALVREQIADLQSRSRQPPALQ